MLTVISFGFFVGIPEGSGYIVDTRGLHNPFALVKLRNLTGLAKEVHEYVMKDKGAEDKVIEGVFAALDLEEGSSLAVGCVGGAHRSVVIASVITARLRNMGVNVRCVHRELGLSFTE